MQIGMAVRRRMLVDRPTAGSDDFLFWRTPARSTSFPPTSETWRSKPSDTSIGVHGSQAATVSASEWARVLVTKNILDMAAADTAWAVPAEFLPTS
jgi:hypothetical protein